MCHIKFYLFQVLCLVSLASSVAGNNHDSLISAQKALHCYPDVAEGWSMLISHLLKMKKNHSLDNLITAMSLHVRNLNPSINLLGWVRKQTSI